MQRREFLAVAGGGIATTVAGCTSEGSEDGDDGGDSPSETGATDESPTDDPTDRESEDENELGFEPLAEGEPDVHVGDGRLVGKDEGYDYDGFGAVTVENRGDGATGRVEIEVEWLDENGETLDDSVDRIRFLRAGETWEVRVLSTVGNHDRIEEVAVNAEVSDGLPRTTEDLHVEETSVETRPSDGVTNIDTTIVNRGEEAVSYHDAIGRVFDEQGRLLGDGIESAGGDELAPGDRWEFELTVALYQQRGGADHEVVPLL